MLEMFSAGFMQRAWIAGLTVSYYADLAPGGTIVLTGTALFILSCLKSSMVKEEAALQADCCHHHGGENEKG